MFQTFSKYIKLILCNFCLNMTVMIAYFLIIINLMDHNCKLGCKVSI